MKPLSTELRDAAHAIDERNSHEAPVTLTRNEARYLSSLLHLAARAIEGNSFANELESLQNAPAGYDAMEGSTP